MTQATDKQHAFMVRLRNEKVIAPERLTRLDKLIASHEFGVLSMDTARAALDLLVQLPDKVSMTDTGLDVSPLDDGRYAVGDVLFLVQAPKAGKWDGWVFVKNGSEYTDERFGSQRPGRNYYGKHEDLLSVVLDDPLAAMQLYGKLTDHCAVCGRRLEDELSVSRGIGPVCWERIA